MTKKIEMQKLTLLLSHILVEKQRESPAGANGCSLQGLTRKDGDKT